MRLARLVLTFKIKFGGVKLTRLASWVEGSPSTRQQVHRRSVRALEKARAFGMTPPVRCFISTSATFATNKKSRASEKVPGSTLRLRLLFLCDLRDLIGRQHAVIYQHVVQMTLEAVG